MTKIIMASFLTAVTSITLLFLVNYSLTSINSSLYIDTLRASIKSKSLSDTVKLPLGGNKVFFPFEGNDCLIFEMLIIPKESRLKATISPRFVTNGQGHAQVSSDDYPPGPHCAQLRWVMENLDIVSASIDQNTAYYHRYIHGDLTVAALLLSQMSLSSASTLLLSLCAAGILILFAAPLTHCLYRRKMNPRGIAFMIISLVLSAFYAMPIFDRSFSFAPTDLVLLIFLIICYFRPTGGQSDNGFLLLVSIYAAMIAILEFLTGGIPMGISTLITMIVLGNTRQKEHLQKLITDGLTVFIATTVFCFMFKLIAVHLVWGSVLDDFRSALLHRINGDVYNLLSESAKTALEQHGLNPSIITSNIFMRIGLGIGMIVYSSFTLGLGSHILGALLTTLPTLSLFFIIHRTIKGQKPARLRHDELFTLGLAACVPFGWYITFSNHTILHSYFMTRLLTWNIALLGIIIVFTVKAASNHGLRNTDSKDPRTEY